MTLLKSFSIKQWDSSISQEEQTGAIRDLEEGKVLYFPNLSFLLETKEQKYLRPEIVAPKAKNISYNPQKDILGGTVFQGDEANHLKEMLRRYSALSLRFLEKILPHYTPYLSQGKTSFRPVEIEGRKTSYRKDDTRLHVDAFPSNPTKGCRILRVFTNINPDGKPRLWRLGEPLEKVFEQFLPKASSPIWGSASLLKLLRVTKDYRTPYDHYMLQIHDSMKGNEQYQKTVSQETVAFPPGSSWIVYTDQVSHAAMSGQHVLEQTFHMPLNSLKVESTAPLRAMERHLKKSLL
jgi:hypothetical protein